MKQLPPPPFLYSLSLLIFPPSLSRLLSPPYPLLRTGDIIQGLVPPLASEMAEYISGFPPHSS